MAITEQINKELLDEYGELMAKYITPDIMAYSSIGCRKRPKVKKLEAENVERRKRELEDELQIQGKYGTGGWRLEMVGAVETPGSSYCNEGYWWILPLKSDNKEMLDYLADESLPRVFQGKEFVVRSTLIPCNGDISWDCR